MIWAVLAGALGIPIWLIVGALLTVFLSRRALKGQEDTFAVSIRRAGESKWPRTVAYARCLRGVLVVNRGVALLRTSIHEVDRVLEVVINPPPRKPADAVGRLLTTSDGSSFEVAAAATDVSRLDALDPG
ncbi:MAG TPA: hypothetical protein VFW06_03775 [Acidimicrobiia bacterium]|nr:hypothetical protein [Acidimicrobiia bacterium]